MVLEKESGVNEIGGEEVQRISFV